MRTMERAAFHSARAAKKLKGLCVCVNAVIWQCRHAVEETVVSDGAFAYGGYPDIDALFGSRAVETDSEKGGHTAPYSAARARERDFRADLDLYLAEWHRAARGGSRADVDRSLPMVGSPRRRAPEGGLSSYTALCRRDCSRRVPRWPMGSPAAELRHGPWSKAIGDHPGAFHELDSAIWSTPVVTARGVQGAMLA